MKITLRHIVMSTMMSIGLALGVGLCLFCMTPPVMAAAANTLPNRLTKPLAPRNTMEAFKPAAPPRRNRMVNVFGKVTTVNGSTFTVEAQNRQRAITVTVTLTDTTKISKETTLALANVPVGQTISAVGLWSGKVFTATQVRVGRAGLFGNLGMLPPAGNGQGNGPRGYGMQGYGMRGYGPRGSMTRGSMNGVRPARLLGIVTQVSSDTITVKTNNGTTIPLKLTANGRIVERVSGTGADLAVGDQIMAMGERNGLRLTATYLNLLLPRP